jgi:uncharacterized protein YukE
MGDVALDGLRASIDEVHLTGVSVDDASSILRDRLTQLQTHLDALGSPWGDGKDGETFKNGYEPQNKWVMDSVAAKVDLLQAYAEEFKRTAASFRAADGG